MSHYDSPIVRLTTGFIDNINDAVIGGIKGISGVSKFAGQLGQGFWLDDSMILWKSATPGYGGHFRYVQLASNAGAVVRGQGVFWSAIAAPGNTAIQTVTTAESGSSDTGMQLAGIVLNASWAAGNYSVIQDIGITYLQFRATLTAAGALGSRVFESASGGADLGFFDVIDSANPTLFSDVSKMMGRYAGVAQEAPTNGGLKRVNLSLRNVRA